MFGIKQQLFVLVATLTVIICLSIHDILDWPIPMMQTSKQQTPQSASPTPPTLEDSPNPGPDSTDKMLSSNSLKSPPHTDDSGTGKRQKRQATGGTSTTQPGAASNNPKPEEHLKCKKLEQKFAEIKKELDKPVDISFKPIIWIALVMAVITILWLIIGQIRYRKARNLMKIWETQRLKELIALAKKDEMEFLSRADYSHDLNKESNMWRRWKKQRDETWKQSRRVSFAPTAQNSSSNVPVKTA